MHGMNNITVIQYGQRVS